MPDGHRRERADEKNLSGLYVKNFHMKLQTIAILIFLGLASRPGLYSQTSSAQARWDTVKLVVPAFKLDAASLNGLPAGERAALEGRMPYLRGLLEGHFQNETKIKLLASDDKLTRELDKLIEKESSYTNFKFPDFWKKSANSFSYVVVYFEPQTDKLAFELKIVSFDRELWCAAQFEVLRDRIFSSKIGDDFRSAVTSMVPYCIIDFRRAYLSFGNSVAGFERALQRGNPAEVEKASGELLDRYYEMTGIQRECLDAYETKLYEEDFLDNDSLQTYLNGVHKINFALNAKGSSQDSRISQFLREVEQFNARSDQFNQMALRLPASQGLPSFQNDYQAFLNEFDYLIDRGIELTRKRREEIAPLISEMSPERVKSFFQNDLRILDVILVNVISIRDVHFREGIIQQPLYTQISGRIIRNDSKICEFRKKYKVACPAFRTQ